MRILAAMVTGLSCVLVLGACGGPEDESATDAARPVPKVAPLGPFVGECGHVTDAEIDKVGGTGQIIQSYKNAVGCNWQGASGTSITFASYRGSPLERERAWVTTHGRPPEPIEVSGRTGFAALDPTGDICDLAIQLDDDFFEWSTQFDMLGGPGGNPCDRSRALAELTIQRLE
ncbi:DUF3558 domain-containing protein [Nocardia carnea]|uniref:DUF3558 domain-containing protein n=1 Tax=Nocardia carnea TaxID=37328 RepID=UPI002458C9B4|nr:DUF3558 domain-containing protein [Nocardia carnea]